MKLKTLIITVAVLTVASIIVSFFDRGPRGPEPDPRAGTALVTRPVLEATRELSIRGNGNEVTIVQPADGGSWIVREYHDLPVDFNKLATLVRNLSEATIVRFASANPSRTATMDLGSAAIVLRDGNRAPLLALDLGRNLSSGGRFVRFDDEERGYVTSFNAWLDTTPKNWAVSALVPAQPEEVTRFEIGFAFDDALVVERASSADQWSADGLPEGATLNNNAINSVLQRVTGLRFTEAGPDTGAPDVTAAREHARRFVLGLGDGTVYTVHLGRRPAPPPSTSESDGEPSDATDEPRPGPVFAFVESSDDDAFNERMKRLAYQVSEFTYTGIAADHDGFIVQPPVAPPVTNGVQNPDGGPELHDHSH